MDLDIRHLKLVRAVTSAGSLTGAGTVLNLTQSALSHQLRDIESRLGTPLFLRVGKRMRLTPAGERLLRSADEVLEAIERTEDSIRQLSGADRGVLRLSTECYTCYHWLPPLLKRYRRAHPNVEVRINGDATSDPLPHLLGGGLDVAILSTPVLEAIIRFYGNSMQGFLANFLEKSVETFLHQQGNLQAQISKMVAHTPLATMADLTRQNLDALSKMQESMLSSLMQKREKNREEDEKRP